METEKYYFRVGAFFLSVTLLFVIYVLTFGETGGGASTVRYAIYFDNAVTGLTRGAPVKMKGIAVGTVDEIRFMAKGSDRILVTADIDENAPVRQDTAASIQYQGITGSTYLSLENGKPDESVANIEKKPGQDYPVIPSQQSGLQSALSNAPELMGGLVKTAAQAQKLLSDRNIAAVQGILDDAHEALTEATGAMRELRLLGKTLREDPSIILRGSSHEGYKVQK